MECFSPVDLFSLHPVVVRESYKVSKRKEGAGNLRILGIVSVLSEAGFSGFKDLQDYSRCWIDTRFLCADGN